jgi:hypothetical protein
MAAGHTIYDRYLEFWWNACIFTLLAKKLDKICGWLLQLRLFQEIKCPENLEIAVSHSRKTISFGVIIFLEWPKWPSENNFPFSLARY